jgi:hypothetical protein
MGQYVSIDVTALRDFAKKLEQAGAGDMKKEFEIWLDGIGNEFLRIVTDEIISREAVDTRLLLSSFTKGGNGNIWVMNEGGLTLEVGTNVEYAKYANDGHRQTPGRFIPGSWNGDRFVYTPGAKTGMVLKASWVEGKHYWEAAIRIIEKMMPTLVEAKFNQWLSQYFGV